jgi:SAM-dependent methyltransferase
VYINLPLKIARYSVSKAKSIFLSALLSYPKRIQCNICGWEGRHFLSDSWHKHINCPKCHSGIRQRLFIATLRNIENLSFDRIISNKTILHFAPENIVSSNIRNKTAHYTTADFLRQDCDFKLDMSHMPEIKNESFDVVIAFDVLEHVPDYQKALEEVHRILSSNGFAIFTVPQKDNLGVIYEDPTIVTPEDRTKHFGQWDHLRIFGDDFPITVEGKGFRVITVNESMFSKDINKKHVLFPPQLSKHPLATNFRKVFFCQKTS